MPPANNTKQNPGAAPKAGSPQNPQKPGAAKAAKKTCQTCCEEWFVVTIERKKKHGQSWFDPATDKTNKDIDPAAKQALTAKDVDRAAAKATGSPTDEGVEVPSAKSLPPKENWGSTSGDFKVEIWPEENSGSGKLVMTGTSIEIGGPESKEVGSHRLIPEGTYKLSEKPGTLHKTYGAFENPKTVHQTPRLSLMVHVWKGPDWVAKRSIDIHTGMDQSWTEGCILLGTQPLGSKTTTKKFFANNELMYEGETPTRELQDSYDTMYKLISELHNFKKKTYAGNQTTKGNRLLGTLTCVKLIIKDSY